MADKYFVAKDGLYGPLIKGTLYEDLPRFCAQEGLKEGSIVEEGKDFLITQKCIGTDYHTSEVAIPIQVEEKKYTLKEVKKAFEATEIDFEKWEKQNLNQYH